MTPEDRLENIHAMLMAGHRSLRLERHSLLLWGVLGALLALFTDRVITADRFPELAQRGVALLVWLAAWLGVTGLVDHRLTRRARRRRAETLPFAQAQVTRAWWMLLGVGTLGSFAMFFYGGGSMIYGLWGVLLGLGLYFFGLFSRRLLEWFGLATMLVGIGALAAHLPLEQGRWLTASCFGVGVPLGGWLAERVDDRSFARSVLALLAWLAAVAGLPLAATRMAMAGTEPPAGPTVAAGSTQIGLGEAVLRLPAGTQIPLRLDLDGPLLGARPGAEIPLPLSVPVEIALRNGAPDGRYRIAEGRWHHVREGALTLRVDRIDPRLEEGRPTVHVHAALDFPELDGARP